MCEVKIQGKQKFEGSILYMKEMSTLKYIFSTDTFSKLD